MLMLHNALSAANWLSLDGHSVKWTIRVYSGGMHAVNCPGDPTVIFLQYSYTIAHCLLPPPTCVVLTYCKYLSLPVALSPIALLKHITQAFHCTPSPTPTVAVA
jgi:hypothetical protein